MCSTEEIRHKGGYIPCTISGTFGQSYSCRGTGLIYDPCDATFNSQDVDLMAQCGKTSSSHSSLSPTRKAAP